MNTSPDKLPQALRAWRVSPPPDPRFRARVWDSIGLLSELTWYGYLRTHTAAWALAAVLAAGIAGAAGRALAHARVQADRQAIVTNYLAEVDPRTPQPLKR